ncbi:hypothetical protein O3G_MSEX014547 [Manduca sexta]|uniref:Uncharacterized protein n=1 Tax=Manduca sexta TaxID=7130 RepID=A0A922D080_MANSE|nr:hypothetical protein O3G_MSEX014547 [Manduca sexta]
MFESRHRPDDLFMDPEEDNSNRSTPNRQSRGRDSLISRTDQSEKDEEHSSRPSSVLETRKRRQSSHDLHRSVTRYSPSPHDHSRIDDALKQFDSGDSEVVQLKQQLSVCQQELEELRERYKDLDEECETCAEYLHWTKLHSLVVDRMSYDAEVEKNKKLSKTIEELRYKNQDLKMTLAKMQKALEKHSGKDNRELEAMKEELKDLKDELAELRQRNKELDEECETCAEYLRERDEQNRRLKEAKAALEAKLQEYQESSGTLARSKSARRKRQTMHDLNRSSAVNLSDAATETTEDFLSSQVERDDSCREATNDPHSREIKRLKIAVEKLSQQKAALEKQLLSNSHTPAHPTVYVATGSAIVQNQQLTDVMKENQKLKNINAKLINICKKRGKSEANRENEDPSNQ